MPKAPAKLWRKSFGGRGYTVTVTERVGSPHLWLYWWNRTEKKPSWHNLRHADRDRAEGEALAASLRLKEARSAKLAGVLTVGALFAAFETKVVAHEQEPQKSEDERRVAVWRTALGNLTDVVAIDRDMLDTFVRQRKAGTLKVEGVALKAKISNRGVGADLEFLRRVFNWAATVLGPDKRPLTTVQPLRGYEIPRNARPHRPIASYERWQAVRAKAALADPQGLFPYWWDILDWLGWRLTAICEIAVGDVDLERHHDAPYGRIKKRGEVDKEEVDMWVPLPKELQVSLRKLLKQRAKLGPMEPSDPLFPAPKNPAVSWHRWHPRQLLERAEKLAGLTPIQGGDFHPYRRAWATARKHLPRKDVAAAGAWRSTRMVDLYTQEDPGTMLSVVSTTNRVRDLRSGRSGQKRAQLSKTHSNGRR